MRSSIACALLASALLATAASAQATAHVNDPMSHGRLGDNKLSLDEGIRLVNSQLQASTPPLSPAELAQVTGVPISVVEDVLVDATITPVITIESKLTDIIGNAIAHTDAEIIGINGRPVFDATASGVAEVFPCRTNHFHLEHAVVKGGVAGVVGDSSLHYHPGEIITIHDCLFVGQSQVGIRINVPAFPPGGIQPVLFQDTVVKDLPLGVEIVDQGFSGDTDVNSQGLVLDGCQVGLRIVMNGGGGKVDAFFDGMVITGATTAVQVTRQAGSDSTLNATFTHGSFTATGSAFDVQGSSIASIGNVALKLWHCDLRAGAGSGLYALRTWPSAAPTNLDLGETQVDGDVSLAAGRFAQAMRIDNSRLRNGSLAIDSTGPSPDLHWTVLESAPVTIAATTNKPVLFDQCELVRSSVVDQTASGVTTLLGCVLAASTTSGNVTNQGALASRWIGQAAVTPKNPALGGFVDLGVDLQPGTVAVWLIGLPQALPVAIPLGYRLYFDPNAVVRMSGQYRLQESVRVSVPNNPYLSGKGFYAQPVVLPVPGQTSAPAITLPRGGRFVVQ